MITNKYVQKYNLQLRAITLMMNYKRKRGLTKNDKILLKSLQRYFDKIQNQKMEPAVGDAVINSRILFDYEIAYRL